MLLFVVTSSLTRLPLLIKKKTPNIDSNKTSGYLERLKESLQTFVSSCLKTLLFLVSSGGPCSQQNPVWQQDPQLRNHPGEGGSHDCAAVRHRGQHSTSSTVFCFICWHTELSNCVIILTSWVISCFAVDQFNLPARSLVLS